MAKKQHRASKKAKPQPKPRKQSLLNQRVAELAKKEAPKKERLLSSDEVPDPKKIAAKLIEPLKQAHADVKVTDPHARVKKEKLTAEQRSVSRSAAAQKAWETIRARKAAAAAA